jgi:hypothetical protein
LNAACSNPFSVSLRIASHTLGERYLGCGIAFGRFFEEANWHVS